MWQILLTSIKKKKKLHICLRCNWLACPRLRIPSPSTTIRQNKQTNELILTHSLSWGTTRTLQLIEKWSNEESLNCENMNSIHLEYCKKLMIKRNWILVAKVPMLSSSRLCLENYPDAGNKTKRVPHVLLIWESNLII